MRFDNVSRVEEVVWLMRLADEPRAEDRRIIQKLFNGSPPFDDSTAEENNIQINTNDLSGPHIMSMARSQWNNAFTKMSNFFRATPDTGPAHKRGEWGAIVTRHANQLLKRKLSMLGQIRETGAQTLLHGVGPVNWRNRQDVIPRSIPMGSLMIPSETEIGDFDESVSYFAVFREWTPAMLYDMTHGTKVDPGWNMPLVEAQLQYLKDQLYKSPTSLAYQYMPERIEEQIKQDKGYFGTDAVPTVDVWDFYFREDENGNGWYRRVMLDWGTGIEPSGSKAMPETKNKVGDKAGFLYSSGDRKYADSLSQIIHCQFGDCSAYAPFKYHSIRSLGWMLWGVCDLQNRLHCKFNEGVFEQLMWFFQTAGNQDLIRLKKASFEHMGIIPQGIKFLTANERFTPDAQLIQMAFARNRQLMSDNSTTYTQAYDRGQTESARTATETMAIVNASQSLSSGILETAYNYETFKYREIMRRAMLKNSSDKINREFRLRCLRDGVPEKMISDVEIWNIEPEQVLGGGSRTLEMATVQFLNTIRPNLPPKGQRMVDNISVRSSTGQPELAEEMAPMGDSSVSQSMINAQMATDRLLRGLPFKVPDDGIADDYIQVWLADLALEIQKIMAKGGVATMDEVNGLTNLGKTIKGLLDEMAKSAESPNANPSLKQKVKGYDDGLKQLSNHIGAFAQRLQQQMRAGMPKDGGNGGSDGKRESAIIMAQTKAEIARNSAAQRTAQKQIQWEREQKRKDQQVQFDIQRAGVEARHDLMVNRMRSLIE